MIITDHFVGLNLPKTGSTFVRTVLKEIHRKQMNRHDVFTRLSHRLGIKKSPIFRELILPNIKEKRGTKRDQHGTYQQIPPQHNGKHIFSVVRNPYKRLISAFDFRSWEKFPPVDDKVLFSEFPHFPNLTLNDFLKLLDLELKENRIPHIIIKTEIGAQTFQFIQMFFKNPDEVLKNLDDEYINSDRFIGDMPQITFLRTENLNRDLYDFLLDQGYPADEIAFILDHEKVNVTKRGNENRSELWTEEAIQFVQYKERFLFKILKHHGLKYLQPIAKKQGRISQLLG